MSDITGSFPMAEGLAKAGPPVMPKVEPVTGTSSVSYFLLMQSPKHKAIFNSLPIPEKIKFIEQTPEYKVSDLETKAKVRATIFSEEAKRLIKSGQPLPGITSPFSGQYRQARVTPISLDELLKPGFVMLKTAVARQKGEAADLTGAEKLANLQEPIGITAETKVSPQQLKIWETAKDVMKLSGSGILDFLNFASTSTFAKKNLEEAGKGIRGFDPELLQPESKSVLLNFAIIFPKEILKEFIALNVESLTSPAAILSLGVGPLAGAGVKSALGLALAGKGAQAAKVLSRTVKVISKGAQEAGPLGVAAGVAKYGAKNIAGEVLGTRIGMPMTVGGVTVGPVVGAAGNLLKTAGEIRVPPITAQKWRAGYFPKGGTSVKAPAQEATIGTLLREKFSPRYSALPENIQNAAYIHQNDIERTYREALALAEKIREARLTRSGNLLAQDLIERQGILKNRWGPATIAKKGEGVGEIALEVAKATEALRKELVKAGFPSSEFQKYKQQYLGIYYALNELPMESAIALKKAAGIAPKEMLAGWKIQPFDDLKLESAIKKIQATLPEGSKYSVTREGVERMLARGEISDATRRKLFAVQDLEFRAVKTKIQEGVLASTGRFQQSILKEPSMWSKTKGVAPDGTQFIQVPKGAMTVIPALRGAWVHPDIYREVIHWDNMWKEFSETNNLGKLMQLWKENVTIDNPPTWIRNITTNFFVADANRLGNPISAPAFYLKTLKEYLFKGKEYQQAVKDGLFAGSTEVRNDVRDLLGRRMLESIEEHKDVLPMAAFKFLQKTIKDVNTTGWAKQAWQKRRDFYQAQDNIFKFLAYRDGILRGIKPLDAVKRGRSMFVDPFLTPYGIRQLSTGITAPFPFMSWQYGMVPQMLQAAYKNPMAHVRWGHFLKSWNAGMAIESGIDPDEIDRITEMRAAQADSPSERFWIRNNPLLSFGIDAYGNHVTLDSASFNPYGFALTGRFFGLNPLYGLSVELLTGKRLYGSKMGQPVPKGEWPQEILRVLAIPNPAAQEAIQAFLRQTAVFDKDNKPGNLQAQILTKVFGESGLGPKFGVAPSAGQSLARVFGLTVKPINTAQEFAKALVNMEKMVKQLEQESQAYNEKINIFKNRQAQQRGEGPPKQEPFGGPAENKDVEKISDLLKENK